MTSKFKLGDKVKFNHCVKPFGSIVTSTADKDLEKEFKDSSSCGYYYCKDETKNKELEGWETAEVNKSFKIEPMIGFISGKKKITHTIYIDYEDAVDTGFGITGDRYYVVKDDEYECYEVCIENKNKSWGKRYVLEKDLKLMKKELDEKTPDGEKIVLTRIDEEKK